MEAELELLIAEHAPGLLAEPGVGTISAAQIVNAWSHVGRLRSEAAFAMLSGSAPIPASSGKIVRHRLNRGGDRQLNRALHTVVLSRMRFHDETKAYVARRTAEGLTPREIKRCLIGPVWRNGSSSEGRAVGERREMTSLPRRFDGQL